MSIINNIFVNVNNFSRYTNINSSLIYGNKNNIVNPIITIAIPTYKRTKLLKQAIDSALNQLNYKNYKYEVLVVDNDPTLDNDTEKLLRSYTNKNLLYYKNADNIGLYGNWNRCIELAQGTWIAFLHDDKAKLM